MHRDESRTDLGTIRIHGKVLASIAAIASTEIEGVKRVGSDTRGGIYDLFAGAKDAAAIKVSIDKHEDVKLDIPLVIKFGYHIPDVCARVQENVRTALDKMTSVSVKDININVRGIERG